MAFLWLTPWQKNVDKSSCGSTFSIRRHNEFMLKLSERKGGEAEALEGGFSESGFAACSLHLLAGSEIGSPIARIESVKRTAGGCRLREARDQEDPDGRQRLLTFKRCPLIGDTPTIIRLPTATTLHLAGRRLHLDGDAGLGSEIEDILIFARGRKT